MIHSKEEISYTFGHPGFGLSVFKTFNLFLTRYLAKITIAN